MSDLVLKTQWHYEENRRLESTNACLNRDVKTLISLSNYYVKEEGKSAAQTSLLTKREYASAIRHWVNYAWPDPPTDFSTRDDPKPGPEVPLLKARKEDVRHWIQTMLEIEHKQPTTVRVYLAGLNNLYEALIFTGAVRDNPCKSVRSPKDKRDQEERGSAMPEKYVQKLFSLNTPKPLDRKTVSEEERLEFLKRCRNQLLLRLWADCGLRLREAFRLKIEDVRLEDTLHLMVTGKGGKVAPTSLNDKTLQAYNLWAGYRDMVAKASTKEIIVNLGPHKLAGERVEGSRKMWQIMAGMYQEANIPKQFWGAHSLRHRYVITALDNKVPMEIVSEGARHASVATTIDIYGKRKVKNLGQLAEVFDNL